MKYLCLSLLILSSANVSLAQSKDSLSDPSGIEVVKFSWSKERIGWENDPFRGPIENFDEMRARARNERRVTNAKGAGNADQVKREANADAANIAAQHKSTPSRYVFMYKATVRNVGNRTIKSLDWDYVFYDKTTETELGRQQFTNEEKIGPGKTRELWVQLTKPPTHTISVTALNKEEGNALLGRVVVVRVEYTDGSNWQLPSDN